MPGNKKRIRLATTIYWLLLFYIVAALIWWFIFLQKQNRQMADFEIKQLNAVTQRTTNPELYDTSLDIIEREYKRNLFKYISEGSTFLVLILIGAGFVYRSVRRQFLLQQQQQNFMMAVTHELKSPMSIARLNLETIQKHQLDPEKQKKLIRMTLDETERLNTLTTNILISSQLAADDYRIATDDSPPRDMFKDCIRNFIQ